MCKVIAITNQKGGVGKTTTAVNLGIGLVRLGRKVLLIDADPKGSVTVSLGYIEPDNLGITLASIMMHISDEEKYETTDGILHHEENVDVLPSNIELSGLEVSMTNVISREVNIKEYIEEIKSSYDYIIIDCMSSLGMMTINALVSADSVLIPVQTAYLPVKGLEQLIRTITMVKKRLNRQLTIEGILLTMVDNRTNYAKDISSKVRMVYGSNIHVFKNVIPISVKAAETSVEESGMRRNQVQRYIRLIELIPELLDMVDTKRIQFTVAVDISYISQQIQQWIYEYIRENGSIKPKQMEILRKYTQLESITQRTLIQIFNDSQVGTRPAVKVTLSEKKFRCYYGSQADQFSFIRIPRMLLLENIFEDLSLEAKVLYGLFWLMLSVFAVIAIVSQMWFQLAQVVGWGVVSFVILSIEVGIEVVLESTAGKLMGFVCHA